MRATAKFSLLDLLLAFIGYSFPITAQTEDPLLNSSRKVGKGKMAITLAGQFGILDRHRREARWSCTNSRRRTPFGISFREEDM